MRIGKYISGKRRYAETKFCDLNGLLITFPDSLSITVAFSQNGAIEVSRTRKRTII